MDDLCVSYVPQKGATPEGELAALAACYAFLIKAHGRNGRGGPDQGEPPLARTMAVPAPKPQRDLRQRIDMKEAIKDGTGQRPAVQ